MKRLVTCLEEKRVLVFALMSLVALTVLAAVSIYQIQTAGTKEDTALQQEAAMQSDMQEAGQDVADAGTDLQPGDDLMNEEVPDAQEIGSQTLVNDESQPEAGAVSDESIAVQADPAAAMNLTYDGTAKLSWPVEGREILMDYSMDSTVYYATLNQYKVSKGILIQAEPGSAVLAPANGLVTQVGTNEEIGNYIELKLGENYSVILGNLTDITVSQDQYILQGTVLGNLAEPTKYYVVEGPNLYLEMRNGTEPVDPLVHLE